MTKLSQNIDVGLEGKAEEEATGTGKCTNMLSNFLCGQSSKANTSKVASGKVKSFSKRESLAPCNSTQ